MVESSYNTDYYGDENNKKPSFINKIKLAFGGLSLVASIIILLSLVSYLFTGFDDQSLINSGLSIDSLGKEVKNWLGIIGAYTSHYLIFEGFGISVFFLVPLFVIISMWLLFDIKVYSVSKIFIFSFFGIIWISSFMGYFLNIFPDNFFLTNFTGNIGYNLSIFLQNLFGFSTILILLLLLFLFIIFYFGVYSININFLNKNKNVVIDDLDEEHGDVYEEKIVVEEESNKVEEKILDKIPDVDSTINSDDDIVLKVEETKMEKQTSAKTGDIYDPELDLSFYKYPKIDILDHIPDKKIQVTKDELESNKEKILETLKNFNIEIAKIKATIGPTVTLYEIVPEAGVKISKIKNLEDDIALSLSALGIRIIAPIPGKGTIGIEVPNKNRELVSLRSVMKTEKFVKNSFELPLILGKTISNEVFITDLTKMPHILVAGATGQGKSVGLNVMLTSLLYKKHPSILKFVLIDPKKVELSLFNKIERHFLAKIPDSEEAIITETKKVVHTLNSLCTEMDVRYNLLKEAQSRNLKEYNKKFINRKLNPNEGHRYLPYIVLVIDELADLMMTAGKEIENPIARLAQLARAIGIHLIIATQRPSVNVITGVIKANFSIGILLFSEIVTPLDVRVIFFNKYAALSTKFSLIGKGVSMREISLLVSLNSISS